MRLSVWWVVALAGCYNAKAKFIPDGVTQEIGAKHLATSTERWTCEGGEELGVLPDGRLFVASQDFLVPRVDDKPGTYREYAYKRDSDGWNVVGAAMAASFLVPSDPKADAVIRYGTLYESSHQSGDRDTGAYIVRWSRTTYAFAPAWADLCWPSSSPLDEAGIVAKLYRGVKVASAPPQGKHFRIGLCGSNLRETGFASDSTSFARSSNVAGVGYAGSEDMAFVPPDVWIGSDTSVTMGRVDGTRFELTHPYTFGGSSGYLYERAQVPIFVNATPGQESVYIYQWQATPMADKPRVLGGAFSKYFIVGCSLEAV